ncbi:MAG TPA: hypothetical protein VMV70_00520 [Gallionella sp.]|nr:hypothetical protein [Gallionella sp.]
MIFDMKATPIFEKYLEAKIDETTATKELLEAMRRSERDNVILEKLKRMEDTHEKAMRIYKQLEPFRLDKS